MSTPSLQYTRAVSRAPGRARTLRSRTAFTPALLLCPWLTLVTGAAHAAAEQVSELMRHDLVGASGKEALMITVTYAAGGASLPHRHDAQVFVYVLEGELTMQVQGQAPVTLRAGQTFYEGPDDIHLVSANASRTAPAKILVFMIKDQSKPASRSVPASHGP